MTKDVLNIQTMRIECEVIGGHASSDVADKLIQAAKTSLCSAVSVALEAGMPDDWKGSDAILCIPKLAFDLDIDVGLDRDQIIRVWARVFAISALKAFTQQSAIRFADQTEQLTAFISDLLHGRAWHQPYWRDFEGLKPLAPSVALRTCLLRDPAIGFAAFVMLGAADNQRLMETLADTDTIKLVEAFISTAPARTQSNALDRLAQRAIAYLHQAPMSACAGPAHFALALIARDQTLLPDAAMIGLARTLALCEITLAYVTSQRAGRDLTSGVSNLGNPKRKTKVITPTDQLPLIQAIEKAAKQGAGPPNLSVPGRVQTSTPFGGAFLLWPHILALPIADLYADLRPKEQEQSITALQRAILVCALGTEYGSRITFDPSLVHLFGPLAQDNTAPARQAPKTFGPAFHDWFIKEGLRDANWRKAGDCCVLKGDAQGYWLRVASKVEDDPRDTADQLATDPGIDLQDATTLALNVKKPLIPQLAQIVCKRMAYRIPGFANASVDFLRRNFLSTGATIMTDERIVEVRLDPAPLSIMLNLTGMSRQRYPAHDGRIVQLAQGGGT